MQKSTPSYLAYINRMASLALIPLLSFSSLTFAQDFDDFTDLSLEELMNVEVTSVNRHAESLFDSAAAVYVISSDDIRRSGATNVPEALRMVPGMNVAQIDSSRWVVGSRAFSSLYTNNLQVMVDGRSIYTPAFNGIYWGQLDIVMNDIDRIEVIRGSGSTLWGANAVNGVINIITKSAGDTEGGYVMGRLGDEQSAQTFRYGAQLNDKTHGRFYIKHRDFESQESITGGDSFDSQHNEQGGFRINTQFDQGDKFTLQGDLYRVSTDQIENFPTLTAPYSTNINNVRKSEGWNLLGRWERPLSLRSDMALQAYFDYYKIDQLAFAPHDMTTFDLDFQHHFSPNSTHDIVWGLSFNTSHTRIEDTPISVAVKSDVHRNRLSAFIQDEIELVKDKLSFTIGSKFERNTMTGTEYQPNARLLWKPANNQTLWGAVSRSVRTPAIGEEYIDLHLLTLPPSIESFGLPVKVVSGGNEDVFDAEKILSYELGYRIQPSATLSFDTTVYYTQYTDMRGADILPVTFAGTYLESQLKINNANEAIGRGLELSTKWQANDDLAFALDYSVVKNSIPVADGLEPDSTPTQKLSLRSMMDVTPEISFDMWLRYVSKSSVESFVGETDGGGVDLPATWNLDLRLAWQPTQQLNLSLVGKNLLHHERIEGANVTYTTQLVEISRSVFAMAEFTF